VVIEQGAEMGRPSRLEALMREGRPEVGGGVVLVASRYLHAPDQ
jgi:predicted PhzF superfamily epimerase YddE/YHI9